MELPIWVNFITIDHMVKVKRYGLKEILMRDLTLRVFKKDKELWF
jgi:hypothetical protein